ncbi:conserved hypothetical protein [Verticillium alfalfae VaMs.102]|uniref:N-acetyltransferase domain-containing protein n=1 Tax=Verticillium alfalfae (strain VaMs.102 / ATCC MYA-4576 / FGSC 10136) TaxID=526221 RepID=C9S5L1_VERA1|nr:conserved hypothetical protein [Verticillium alfalfae VaMs.102]EEY15075.1 conserved hypothetical protein [Verticillium alfalfae VaMs.102]
MPLELRRVEASDHDILERCIVVETAAFDSSHIKPIVYPGPFPPDADERRVAELSETLSKEPNIHFIAVADTEIEGPNAIVAWGKWMVYAEGMPPPKERTFSPGMNFEAAKLMYGGIDGLRKNVEGLKCIYLSVLVTDPAHQGRGAGKLLMQWGADEADRLGLATFLESSEPGHVLYPKFGFQDVEPLVVSLAQFGLERPYRAWGMVRPAKE